MIKKGQFYVFSVVLLCSLVFVSIVKTTDVQDSISEVEEAYQNYAIESIVTINSAIYEQKNVSEQLTNFTLNFIEYAKIKNLDLGILYTLIYPNNEALVVNYLDSYASITTHEIYKSRLSPNKEKIINLKDNLIIEVEGIE